MPRGNKKITASKRIALGGIFSALAVVILLLGGIIPIGTFAAPIFAGICLLPISIDVGNKTSLLCYLVVSVLGFIIVPDREVTLLFIILLGYYPILQPFIGKLKSRVIRWLIKLVLFNAAVFAAYMLLLFVFTNTALLQEFAGKATWFFALILAGANITFVLYDILLVKIRVLYFAYLRKYLLR